jgi:hypothetical protein
MQPIPPTPAQAIDPAFPETQTERTALAAWWLAEGRSFTTAQLAEATGLTTCSARRMLVKISRLLPIYSSLDGDDFEDGDGDVTRQAVWRRLPPL